MFLRPNTFLYHIRVLVWQVIAQLFVINLRKRPNVGGHPLCGAQRSKVACSAWLDFAVTFQSNDYFPFVASFSNIPERLRNLT